MFDDDTDTEPALDFSEFRGRVLCQLRRNGLAASEAIAMIRREQETLWTFWRSNATPERAVAWMTDLTPVED